MGIPDCIYGWYVMCMRCVWGGSHHYGTSSSATHTPHHIGQGCVDDTCVNAYAYTACGGLHKAV